MLVLKYFHFIFYIEYFYILYRIAFLFAETINLRDIKKESKRLESSNSESIKQNYRVETYIVPTVNSPALWIDNEIDKRIANRLKITDTCLTENNSNEKKVPFILHNVTNFARFSDKNNKSINEKKIIEKRTSETILDTLFEEDKHYDKKDLKDDFYNCNENPGVVQNLKLEVPSHFSNGSRNTLYPSRQFRKTNSLPDIDERSEYSVSNKQSNFCQHGYKNGCTATFVPPEEISLEIFKRNCLKKIEILQQWEVELTEREINVQKKEKEVFMMQKELRIAARILNEKLKQVDQYLGYQRNMQVIDRKLMEVGQVLSGKLQKYDELKISKEHQYQSKKNSDEFKRPCVHKISDEHLYQAEKPDEFDEINIFDEIENFNELMKLSEIRRSNDAKKSDEFKFDKVKKSCTHKISDEHPYEHQAENPDELKSGEINKLDEIKKCNDFMKHDEVRRSKSEIKKSDEFEKFDDELKKTDNFKINNESAKIEKWRNSQSLINTYEEKGSDIKIRRSRIHSSSRQSCLSTANSRVRTYSSLKYKERPKISYDDLNSTLSADPGDSSFVRTSEQFFPHVYKKPNAFTRSTSVRCTRQKDNAIASKPQETIDIEGKLERNIDEEKVLRRFSENIQASQDKDTKFQHYGLVNQTSRNIQATVECNSHNQGVFSYLNLEVDDKHIRKLDSVSTTRPNSCNIEMDEWLQKKRLAYTLATTKPSDKENLECNIVKGKNKKSSKKKIFKKIFR